MNIFLFFCYLFKDSYFEDLSASSGGALYWLASKDKKLLVESSMFIRCSASSQGGALYMWYGNCILSKLCGVECEADYGPPFSYVELFSVDAINKILESTVSKCKSTSWGYTIDHLYGNIESRSVNASQNECYCCAGIYFDTKSDSTCVATLCYPSVPNNTASNYGCCMFWYGKEYDIEYTNIIFNSVPEPASNGLIYTDQTTTLTHVSVLGNIGYPIFHNTKGGFTIIDCVIDCDQMIEDKISANIFITDQMTTETRFIQAFDFVYTGDCKIQNFVIEVEECIPEETPQQTEKVCECDCKLSLANYKWHFEEFCDDTNRINNWLALEYLLLISCLPTDPAKDIWYDVNSFIYIMKKQ